MWACCAPPTSHSHNTDSGGKLCSQSLFITHKRLCLKPRMPPRGFHYRPHLVSPQKGPPVSSTWKPERGKQGAAVPSSLSDGSIQVLDLMGVNGLFLRFLRRHHIFLSCGEKCFIFLDGSRHLGVFFSFWAYLPVNSFSSSSVSANI